MFFSWTDLNRYGHFIYYQHFFLIMFGNFVTINYGHFCHICYNFTLFTSFSIVYLNVMRQVKFFNIKNILSLVVPMVHLFLLIYNIQKCTLFTFMSHFSTESNLMIYFSLKWFNPICNSDFVWLIGWTTELQLFTKNWPISITDDCTCLVRDQYHTYNVGTLCLRLT